MAVVKAVQTVAIVAVTAVVVLVDLVVVCLCGEVSTAYCDARDSFLGSHIFNQHMHRLIGANTPYLKSSNVK